MALWKWISFGMATNRRNRNMTMTATVELFGGLCISEENTPDMPDAPTVHSESGTIRHLSIWRCHPTCHA